MGDRVRFDNIDVTIPAPTPSAPFPLRLVAEEMHREGDLQVVPPADTAPHVVLEQVTEAMQDAMNDPWAEAEVEAVINPDGSVTFTLDGEGQHGHLDAALRPLAWAGAVDHITVSTDSGAVSYPLEGEYIFDTPDAP